MTREKRGLILEIEQSNGFGREVIEKVLTLTAILKGLSDHEQAHECWLLKGGTALNLLYLNLPRLSVDIDLNLIGVPSVHLLPDARKSFEAVLTAVCQREGCAVKRVPRSHAGGKFRLQFSSVFGGTQNLEVDVNYVMRTPLHGVMTVESTFPPKELIGDTLKVPTLGFPELAASKFSALVSRFAARDVFDADSVLKRDPGLLESKNFRIAFLCYGASSRTNLRELKVSTYALSAKDLKEKLLPLLQHRGREEDVLKGLAERLEAAVLPAIKRLLTFSPQEKKFLDTFLDSGDIDPTLLTDDPALRKRILEQPMLLWKQQHIRERVKNSL